MRYFFKWYYPLGERGEGVAGGVDSLLALRGLPQGGLDPRLRGCRGQEGLAEALVWFLFLS